MAPWLLFYPGTVMPENLFHLSDYDFLLPKKQIAQQPADRRDASRLMVLYPDQQRCTHGQFPDIVGLIAPNDLLVINNTKVFPARLLGQKTTGGKAELFLLHFPTISSTTALSGNRSTARALCLVKSSQRPRPGSQLLFAKDLIAEIERYHEDGKAEVVLHFPCSSPEGQKKELQQILHARGQMPLPPYIQRTDGTTEKDRERYQTIYARHPGSVAAPTAGLHFSDDLLGRLRHKGVGIAEVTLHVGYGTFAPVRSTDIREHQIHCEQFTVPQNTAEEIARVQRKGGKIWAVGTTTARTLEYVAARYGAVIACTGNCDLYIYPGYRFSVVDNLITNFHLPKSSLLFLVSALAGRQCILDAYREAISKEYRFFSYGDAMAIITAT